MKYCNFFLALLAVFFLVSDVSAVDYLERLRELDQALICLVVWFTPLVVVIMFVVAGFLYLSGEEGNRVLAKNLIMNAVIGFLLVFVLVFISMALLSSISIDKCF